MGLKTYNEFHKFIYFPIHTKLAHWDFVQLEMSSLKVNKFICARNLLCPHAP